MQMDHEFSFWFAYLPANMASPCEIYDKLFRKNFVYYLFRSVTELQSLLQTGYDFVLVLEAVCFYISLKFVTCQITVHD